MLKTNFLFLLGMTANCFIFLRTVSVLSFPWFPRVWVLVVCKRALIWMKQNSTWCVWQVFFPVCLTFIFLDINFLHFMSSYLLAFPLKASEICGLLRIFLLHSEIKKKKKIQVSFYYYTAKSLISSKCILKYISLSYPQINSNMFYIK